MSVGLSVTIMSPGKMAEPTGMWLGPRNHALDRGSDPQCKGAILRGKGAARCKV